MSYKRCPKCKKKMDEVDWIEDFGTIFQCPGCTYQGFINDDGELEEFLYPDDDYIAEIWKSSGMDEDSTFGISEDILRSKI